MFLLGIGHHLNELAVFLVIRFYLAVHKVSASLSSDLVWIQCMWLRCCCWSCLVYDHLEQENVLHHVRFGQIKHQANNYSSRCFSLLNPCIVQQLAGSSRSCHYPPIFPAASSISVLLGCWWCWHVGRLLCMFALRFLDKFMPRRWSTQEFKWLFIALARWTQNNAEDGRCGSLHECLRIIRCIEFSLLWAVKRRSY